MLFQIGRMPDAEASFPRLRGKRGDIIFFDMDMGLGFQLNEEFPQLRGAPLGFHENAAVGQVCHPAGHIQVFRDIHGGVPESHVLHLAKALDAPSNLRAAQMKTLLDIAFV